MLVLGRKENERLIIDGNIVVTVVRASNGTVRLGIDAPAHISIKREELLLESPLALNHGRFTAASPV